MAKNSPNKRKSQNKEVQQTPKKQKLTEDNEKTPVSNKKNIPKQQNTPKVGGNKNSTPKSQKKNTQKEKLEKFTGTANLQEKGKPKEIEEADPSSEESDYEVEQEVKPEKITKTMNEDNQDSDEADADDSEEIDNAVNENSENDEKKQKTKQKNAANKDKQPDVNNIEEIKAFIEKESAKEKKMRYVLFLGNLPYDVSTDDIKKHFEKGIQITSVRLPIGKGPDKKPRGFGYLEVTDKDSYFNALSKHHTFLKGRRLNVLYTTGGKKNSANIKTILKKKNFKLNALRKAGKLEGGMKHSNKRSVRRAKKRSFEKKTE